jgi:hypothetical protein
MLTFGCVLRAAAQEGGAGNTTFRAEVGTGIEYDSNVSVTEVDAASGESDVAIFVDAGVAVKHRINDRTEVGLNYDFTQNRYDEFSEVNRQTHLLGVNGGYDLGRVSAGFSGYFIHSRLDGEAFLDYTRISPALSGFLSRRFFARGAYVYSERKIDQNSDRNADTSAWEGDLYFFWRGLRSYFNIGYRYRNEDADSEEFDFSSHSLKLRYIQRLQLLERDAKLEFAWRFEDRDYRSPTPEIGEERMDNRSRWKVDLEVQLNPSWYWQLYSGYGDYSSNLPRADFTQTVLGTRIDYRW